MRKMKDSGIPWIGEIPEKWEVGKAKYCVTISNGSNPNTEGDIPVYGSGASSFKTCGEFKEGPCVLVGRKGATLHIPHYIDHRYWNVDTAFDVKPKQRFSLKYYYYLASCFDYKLYISQTTLPGMTQTNYENMSLPVPEEWEQKRIVDLLDTECARIDAVIELTRASIEEYKKLKQAVITQAVTKGIRPNRPMKDSGIDWIGKVPCDWKVTKLKYSATIRSGITLGKVYPAGTKLVEYPYLRVANVQGSYTDLRDVATIAVTEEEAEKYRLHDGELLMTEGGDRDKLGRGTVWHAEIDPCLHQNHVFALRTNEKLLAEYVSYLSESLVGRDYFDVTANQSVHLASTNSTTILNFAIPYPLMDEQKAIVEYLKRKTMEIDIIMEKKQRLLFNVEAYKKSVIYEHVTGKKGDGSIEKTY